MIMISDWIKKIIKVFVILQNIILEFLMMKFELHKADLYVILLAN